MLLSVSVVALLLLPWLDSDFDQYDEVDGMKRLD
jgi:hypothetical protein